MNKLKQFDDMIEAAEELLKTGVITGIKLDVNSRELIDRSIVGGYYKITSSDIHGSVNRFHKSTFYEKTFRNGTRDATIRIHLYRQLDPKEVAEYKKFRKECQKNSAKFRDALGLVGDSLPF